MSRKTKNKKKRQKKVIRKIPPWISPLILGFLVIGTFLIRVIPSWSEVIINGQVWYREVDAIYHMRLADNMMVNFPIPLRWDMLALYPAGMNVGYFPLLSWIITIFGHLFNYELVGAFFPPILGALTLIPIYFICKTLWKDWVGLIACLLVMILPTEFFHRSLLGFTDHHILEIFFLTTTILFLILLSKNRKLRWIILAGISLGLYLSSWGGGLLLVLLIWIWFLISAFNKLRKEEPIKTFCIDISIVLGLGFLFFIPNVFLVENIVAHVPILGLMAISPIILYLVSKKLSWKVSLLGLLICLILSAILIQIFLPGIISAARSVFISPTTTIQEAFPAYPKVLMAHYGVSFLLFIGGLIYSIKKKENLLLIIWCIFMLILAVSQRRWSYYFAINNSILAGYFIYLISRWVHRETRYAVIITICIILLATTLPSTIGISRLPAILSDNWYQACIWLNKNTPEIEGYYDLNVDKPDYGVLSWWDYGDFITRIGRRVPCSNPMSQNPSIQWQVFLAQSEEEANTYLVGIDYIIVDLDMVTTKFYAIVDKAPSGTAVNENAFIFKLWYETTTTWNKIHQEGDVKIYGRS
jgi:dolichyl-diphosphooligosaccharide--protein glycosyltransferase